MAEEHAKEEHPEEHKHPDKHETASPSSPPHGSTSGGRDTGKSVCAVIFVVLLLAGFTAFIIWLVYRPHKPRFTVTGAAVYDLNVTSLPFISTSVQFTVLARNPNHRVSILYDHLSMRVTYRDQIITPPLDLPPLRLGKKTTVVIAPVMGGAGIPVAPEVANGLRNDVSYGAVLMRVGIVGKLRWKAGAIKTGRYGFYVKCDVWLGLKKGSSGQVPLLAPSTCKTDL